MQPIKLWWYKDEGPNTGDLITPGIFDKLEIPYEYSIGKEFIGAGSIFQRANKNTTIGGSGVHKLNDRWPGDYDINKVIAVRGKLTYDLLNTDKEIPLGDPGLLLGKFYKPNKEKKYKCCLLAHYTEYNKLKGLETPTFPVYNMMVYGDNPIEQLVDKISECECVLSSSLHGLIFAHSLGIPALHLNFTNLYNADAFKFRNYYSVFDTIDYTYTDMSNDFNLAIKYVLEHKDEFRPSEDELTKIQDSLLEVLPHES